MCASMAGWAAMSSSWAAAGPAETTARERIANKSDTCPCPMQRHHHCLQSATALRLSAVQQLTILLRDAASQPLGELLERGHDAVAVAAAVRVGGDEVAEKVKELSSPAADGQGI